MLRCVRSAMNTGSGMVNWSLEEVRNRQGNSNINTYESFKNTMSLLKGKGIRKATQI
jgi:hypothetical protein